MLLNEHLQQQCQLIAEKRHHPEYQELTIEAVFQEERTSFRELIQPFDGYKEISTLVHSTCLIHFDRNRYSVDCAYANKTVTLKVYALTIEVFADNEHIGGHQRVFGRNKTLFNPWHYLPLLERKPGALRNGAPFKDWQLPPAILKVKNILMKRRGGDRECVDVLLAMSEHGVEDVAIACELAITEQVVSRDYIINALHRLRPTAQPQATTIPSTLKLKEEPTSNCHKYNLLLTGAGHAVH